MYPMLTVEKLIGEFNEIITHITSVFTNSS